MVGHPLQRHQRRAPSETRAPPSLPMFWKHSMTALVRGLRPDVTGRPPAITHELDASLRFVLNQLDPPFSPAPLVGHEGLRRYRLRQDNAPSPAVREALRQRLRVVEDTLTAAGHAMATEEYRILCTMKAPNATDDEIRRESVGFIEGTADLPAFALREACDAFRLGGKGEGEWMPKVGQVRREAERLAMPYRRQLHELRMVLEAEIGPPATSTPEGRAANVSRVAAWIAEAKAEEERASGRGMSEQEIARAKEIDKAVEAGMPIPGPIPKLGLFARKAMSGLLAARPDREMV